MREDKIYKLEILIREYREENEKLTEMLQLWEDGDPMSDPGLQYEQECKIEKAYKAISEYIKNEM